MPQNLLPQTTTFDIKNILDDVIKTEIMVHVQYVINNNIWNLNNRNCFYH